MKRRILALLLTICLIVPMLSVTANAASNDYKTWKQSDSAWNQQIAWPAKDYPKASMRYMRQAGCVVTSIAMLLRHYKVVTDSNVNSFNPWICNEKLKSVGAFTDGADLRWKDVSKAYPRFKYEGRTEYFSQSELYSLYSQGYACLVKVNYKGSFHYVAVQSATNYDATIMDPGSSATSLSSYGTKYQIVYFKVSGNEQPQRNTPPTISGQNTPSSLRKGQSFSIKGTISSSTSITSVVAGVYTAQSGGTKKTGGAASPNRTSYDLANLDSVIYFNRLDPGTYYYRVTATNSVGTAILINSKFTVTSPTDNTASSYATISNANYPPSLKPGQTYSIKGTISSKTRITSVTVGVYTSSSGSNMITGKTVRPNSTSYNLKNIDPYVYFNRLSAGNYYYIVKATNSAGTATLVSRKFVVGNSVAGNWGTLVPKCAPRARADVDNAGTRDGTNVQLYAANGTNAQTWRLVDLGNGYYAIQSKLSVACKCLDVAGGRAVSGTNVQLYSWNQSNAQQWKLVDAGGGYYYICSRLNPNLCLDVSGGGSANGTNLQVYTRNNSDAQKWKFA
ncbi:MAG: RICIN domain-containing protein [Oscillospiraceae bacterium]|nr:RICIN domain-containing protein [Oscillospiraceae bacterium]